MADHYFLTFLEFTVYLCSGNEILAITNLICAKSKLTRFGKIGSCASDLNIGSYDLGEINENLCGKCFLANLGISSGGANALILTKRSKVDISLAACYYLGSLFLGFRLYRSSNDGNYAVFFTFSYKTTKVLRILFSFFFCKRPKSVFGSSAFQRLIEGGESGNAALFYYYIEINQVSSSIRP